MALNPVPRALLDTSVVIDPPPNLADYGSALAISTVTLAELAYGLHVPDPVLAAARQARYARIEELYEEILYSASAARIYGALCASVRDAGRSPRPRRMDLLIASVAVDEGVPLLTRNPTGFAGLHPAARIIAIPPVR